ncbi:hypothetical protein [Brevundimonas sp. Root1279]|uniref:hypothetical protein n=1 Tax=Brevundimonas sp. Root1279 TaxID=1736443 RepID=UPI0006FDC74A|nr:hypothetical protein [Brevundimonas sp. Root1279]KQW86585.1 hypothetical protein ASC65_01440 [Brevundimonas sp. Root1279]
MTREAWVWFGLAMLSLLWCGVCLALDGGLLLPALAATVTMICAADASARGRTARGVGWVFSGSIWRTALILVGALMLIQLLPVEMALLLAGDVLAYVEVLAAVGLIAANTRLKAVVEATRRAVEGWLGPVLRTRTAARAIRSPRPPRRPSSADDADGRGWAFA